MAKRVRRTKPAILGFLSWKPMSGYEIKQVVTESVGNFWNESFGQIYPALHRMESAGWICRRPPETESEGGRTRHKYELTNQGRDVLAEWLDEPPVARKSRNELLLKVFFAAQGDLESVISHIADCMTTVRNELERYGAIQQDLGREEFENTDAEFWRLTARYGELERRAHLAWCREALKRLRSLRDARRDPDSCAATNNQCPEE